jgi:Trypsin-like peptidase domain
MIYALPRGKCRHCCTALAVLLSVWPIVAAANDYASFVYGVDAKPTGAIGSATFLCSNANGAYFATCYHVLRGAQQFTLWKRDGKNGEVKVADERTMTVVVDRPHDLVLIALPAANGAQQKLGIGALTNPLPATKEGPAVALGYPFINRRYRYVSDVFVWGQEKGINLRLVDGSAVMVNQEAHRPLLVRFLRRENTLPGMSGGPVVALETPPRLAGIVFARIPDTQGLCISVDSIQDLYKQRAAAVPFKPQLVTARPPFTEKIPIQAAGSQDSTDLAWDTFQQWGLLLTTGQEARSFLGEFQEVHRDVAAYEAEAPTGPMTIDCKAPDCAIWLNGTESTNVPLNLSPGENLVVLRKKQPRKERLTLNDFVEHRNVLAAELGPGGTTWLKVTRSLPAVVEEYAIFVTLTNGEGGVQWGPPAVRPANSLTYEAPPRRFANLLKRVQAAWHIDLMDPRTGSRAAGCVSFDQNRALQFRRVSSQTIDVEVPLTLAVEQLRLRVFGLDISPDIPALKNLRMTVWFRLQIVSGSAGRPRIIVRALAGWMEDPLTIDLLGGGAANGKGLGLAIDLRAIFSEAFAIYLNRYHLRPDEQGNSDLEAILLAASGSGGAPLSWMPPAILGFTEDARLAGRSLQFTRLGLRGENAHFKLEAEGTFAATNLVLNDQWRFADTSLSFKLRVDSSLAANQLGQIEVKIEKGSVFKKAPDREIKANLPKTSFVLTIGPTGDFTLDRPIEDIFLFGGAR